MKNTFITILLLLTFLFSKAQRFEKYYGGPGADYGVDVSVMSDQSIVSVGTSNSYGHGGDDIVVTKTDSAGLLLWSRYFGGVYNDQGKSIAISNNDDIYVCGVLMGAIAGSEDIQLSKISKDGVVLWTKTYGGTSSDIVNDIVIKSNKIYMIGSTKSFGAGQNDIYFLSTDTAGTIITTKTIGTTGNDVANSITKTTDGNFLICGTSDFYVGSEVFAAKINLHGDTLWVKRFINYSQISNFSYSTANAIIELTDKQILITGFGFITSDNYSKSFHIRLDSLGNIIYVKYYGSFNYFQGFVDAISTNNGGYIILTDFLTLNKFDNSGTGVWSKRYQDRFFGQGRQPGSTSGRLAKLYGGKFLLTGAAFLLNNTNDIYIAKLDSNGIAYATPDPLITSTGPTTFCQGDSVLLTVPNGFANYQWTRSVDNGYTVVKTYLPNNTSSIYAKEAGSYLCLLTKANGTRLTQYLAVTVNPSPTTTVTLSGPTNFCASSGQSITLISAIGNTSYQWRVGGVPIVGATTSSYVANSSGNYSVDISNACGTRSSSPITINSTAPPTCSISCVGNGCDINICNTGHLEVTNNGNGATYNWYNGTTLTYVSSSNSFTPSSSGSYTCKVITHCGTTTSAPYFIFGSNAPPLDNTLQASGPTFGCGVGNSVLFTAPNTSSAYFQWYLNNSPIASANSSTYLATTSGSYQVQYFNIHFTCGRVYSDPVNFIPDTNAIAKITATAGTTICSGTLPLTASVSGAGVTYQWYFNNVNSPIGFSTTTYQASATGTYFCRVSRPCGNQFTDSISLYIGSPTITTPFVNVNLCQGSSKNIYVSPLNAFFTYQWKLNSTLIVGANTNNYTSTQTGVFTCDVSNTCSTVTSSPITVTQVALPTPIISATGNTNLCPSQTCSLSTPLINGTYYFWKNGLSYSQAGTNQNNFTASTIGSYTVTVTDPNGCTGISAPVVITSSTVPTASLIANDYPLICYGSPLLLRGKSYSNANYVWYRNNVIISGAIDSFYIASSNGDFNYMVTNACGTSISGNLHITTKAKPTALINALSSTNFCLGDSVILQASVANGNTYTWYKNNIIINNALSDAYTAKIVGNYLTKVTNNFGCYKQSNTVSVTVPCRASDDVDIHEFNLNAIHVYPNPSNDIVYFEVPKSTSKKYIQVTVYDTQGRQIAINLNQLSDSLWTLSDLDNGMYILKVNDATTTVSRTFVVIK